MIGKQLGHYRILDRLGAGGMGVVWLAEDLELGRKVALKTLRSDIAASPALLARFQREARAVAALNHANIVTLYSVEEADDLRFLVMEYVDGVRLDEQVPTTGLEPIDVVEIGAAIADALAAAHERGIVHRDLKPGNVLLTPDGRVKVVDFGLARAVRPNTGPFGGLGGLGGDTTMTQDGHAMGTIYYMSPEQLEGKPLDHRSDLFSLGVVLFEMASGERPFFGDSAVQVISAILRDRPRRLDGRSSRLPPEVVELVDRLLAKRAEDRPGSAAEVRDALLDAARALSGDAPPGTARPALPRPRRRAARPMPRRDTALIAGVFAVAALLVVGATLWSGWRPARVDSAAPPATAAARAPSIAVLPLANYSGDPDYFVDGMTDGVIGALARVDGLRVISRQSTMLYKESAKRLPEIARELGVDYIVQASLRRQGSDLRVEVTLFRPDPETSLWTDKFLREPKDVLVLQTDVARGIANAIDLGLRDERSRLSEVARVDPAVYEAYVRGRQLLEQMRPESLHQALAQFDEALRVDPGFAPAHSGRARAYGLLAYLYDDPATNARRQNEEALRAIELDPELSEAHATRGDHLRYFEWEWAGAEASYRTAIRLDPNSAPAHRGLWGLLACLGRLKEARAEVTLARKLDPLSAAVESDLGYQALFEGNVELAKSAFRRALEIDPDYPSAHAGLWLVGEMTGSLTLPGVDLAAWLRGDGYDDLAEIALGTTTGTHAELTRAIGLELERRTATQRVPIGLGVALLATSGESERALAWLRRALAERDPELVWLAMDPAYRKLRDAAGFRELLLTVGLPQARELRAGQ